MDGVVSVCGCVAFVAFVFVNVCNMLDRQEQRRIRKEGGKWDWR